MNTQLIPISHIIVPGERFRTVDKDADFAALKDSIRRLGLLNPILVEAEDSTGFFVLVAGEHRLTACTDLGWTDIPANIRADIDETKHREIELEENIRRRDITPAQRVRAIAEIHRLKTAENPNWTQVHTAAYVGTRRQAGVSDMVTLDKMLDVFPELGEAKTVNQMMSWARHKGRTITRMMDVHEREKSESRPPLDVASKILLGDSVDIIKSIPDGSFDLILTDPPFGLDYDSRKSDSSGAISSYSDSPDEYRRILSMAPDMYRVLKDNGWLVFFFGISWYEEVKRTFRDAGFIVDELPIVWNRSGGKSYTNRPDRYFARAYDVAIHALKGDPQIVRRGLPNVITINPIPNASRETLVERPIELYEELISRLTVRGESVADFFVGSGSCPAAAAKLGRDFFGCELDPERRAYAITKIEANIPR